MVWPNSKTLAVSIVLLLAAGVTATAQTDPTTAFELEGNIADDVTLPIDDWVNVNCPAIGGGSADVFTGAVPDPAPMSIFTQGGSKDREDISEWRHKDGSVPDKDDIVNAYAAQYTIGSDVLLYVGGDRYAVNGAAFIGAWFFQNPVGLNPDGTFDGLHKDGDILILAEFTQGGAIATALVYEWVGTDPSVCPPDKLDNAGTLCDITPTAFPVTAIGFSNDMEQTIPASCTLDWAYTPKSGSPGVIPINGFFEAGINYTSLGLANTCFASVLIETRSSQEVDAQLKDFVLTQFAPCGVECSKTVAPAEVCEGNSVVYTHTVDNIDGGAQVDVTIQDDNGTPADTSDDFFICFPANADGSCNTQATSCTSTLAAGGSLTCTRTVTPTAGVWTNIQVAEIVAPPGTEGCMDSATVTVNPNPSVSINTFTCTAPSTWFTLTASPVGGTTPYSYLWSTTDTTQSITESVGGSYSVTVTDAKSCTATAMRDVGYCTEGCP